MLLIFTVNAQNVWYVNFNNTSGTYNGQSWATAWRTLDKYWSKINGTFYGVDWDLIESGDTIYVSGGSDSTTYIAQTINASGYNNTMSFDPPVVICPSWESGHNGGVYIKNTNPNKIALAISGFSGLKISKFNVYHLPNVSNAAQQCSYISSGNSVTIDNCHFVSDGSSSVLTFADASQCTLSNTTLETLSNTFDCNQDILGLTAGNQPIGGGHTIIGNILISRAEAPVNTAHMDMIQIGGEWTYGNDEFLTTTIASNFIWAFSEAGAGYSNMIYAHGVNKQRFLFYNNLIVADVPDPVSAIALSDNEPNTTVRAEIYNNTFIINDGSPIYLRPVDSLKIKNNIVIQTKDGPTYLLTIGYSNTTFNSCYKDIDYNHYYRLGGTGNTGENNFVGPSTGTNRYDWTTWRGMGYDIHSDTGYISLADVRDSVISAYMPPSNLLGIDLSSIFTTDIVGNLRTNWSMSALEFDGTPPSGINVKSKIFLQGPFTSNSMSTTLTQSSLLPNSQPYNTPPWNYNGSESFVSDPNSTMVDWVLVELRNPSNPSQLVARRAAILKNNGLLLNTSGSEGVVFNNVDPGSYYIAIYHRNHLAIMSASPVALSLNSTLYDFTTTMNKAFGQNPMVELSPGKFGMYASDGNADGIVNTSDRDDVWLIQNGSMGYLGGDFNMNSGVTVHDVNQLWNLNNGVVTQVP
jgi:hypothetical protein